MTRRTRDDRGAVATELVVVIPALVIIIGLLVAGGRIWLARQGVQEAAASAARAASLARGAGEARQAAEGSAAANLDTQGLTCRPAQVVVDTRGYARAPGTEATVGVTVTCTITLADVAVPGLPGSMTLTTRATSALDTFRSR
ncbi:TadE/TadG family type IV pilus assembly protein [Auraticoccus monumenti]|uniref:TadE-like protein n=1 Tax=Auraticoccus monumenti TaxID=675864 RepID=A0A1G6UU37_9ACTN|nr:TadE/TadG family type IV pilus assembly protein [Auraticoccus monumenti]SDD44075.1 TadE-like protein [Auraticoccus monumenti]